MRDETDFLIALLTGSVVKLTALAWMSRSRETCVGRVSKLDVFPLKSARALEGDVQAITVTKHGVCFKGALDRHWMVTNKNGTMVAMLNNSRLTLITTSLEGETLRLDADSMEPLRLPIEPPIDAQPIVQVNFKGQSSLATIDMGDEAASWVAKVLQQAGVRLNYAAPTLTKRRACTTPKDWKTFIHPNDEVAVQEYTHCLLMTESSVADLNTRLPKPITGMWFRPNVMVDGSQPYDEDNWREIRFGESTTLRFVDRCQRCLVVTMDPRTGVKDKNGQPLTELKKYRCFPDYGPVRACMGIHTAVKTEGEIKLGDPVYVIRK